MGKPYVYEMYKLHVKYISQRISKGNKENNPMKCAPLLFSLRFTLFWIHFLILCPFHFLLFPSVRSISGRRRPGGSWGWIHNMTYKFTKVTSNVSSFLCILWHMQAIDVTLPEFYCKIISPIVITLIKFRLGVP